MTLVLRTETLAERSTRWADLSPEERRRRAVRATVDRDESELWSLTEAHLYLLGTRGARLSPHTLRAYRTGARQYLRWAGGRAVNLLRPAPETGALYARFLEGENRSAATVRSRLAAARALYAALRWSGATGAAPFAEVRAAPDPTPAHEKRLPYPDGDLEALIGAADPQVRALLLLCGHAGLRNAEALALTWADVDLDGRTVYVARGKGGRSRRVHLSARTVTALRALGGAVVAEPGRPSADVRVLTRWSTGPGVRRAVRALCAHVGVPYRGVHALRHSSGTKVLRATGNLLSVARHLGHATVGSSEIYAKYANDGLASVVDGW